ncbi:MAG: LysR family transcriptional regulator [Selenomonadaceae bacterium]|nr:LysR family transcriptional regulator [Selenomonadaceae bacterium]
MEFRVLKYFLAVAKHENISKAAEALNLTQPTLSRQIADLEAELGTALLVRSKKRTTLTEAGMFLKARAEEIAALADKTVEQLSHADDLVEGDIYIGCGETEGMAEVIRAIRPLHRSYPRIRVHLTSGNAELVTDRLEKGLLDFALLCRSTPPVEYVYRKLSHEDVWGLFMRRDNPLAVRDGISAEDLLSEPLIVSLQAIESKEFDHWLGQSAENLKIVATYNLAYNSAFLVEQGFGSMLGFAGLISVDAPRRQGIVFRPLLPELHSANYIVWKKGQVFSRAGRLVMAAFEAAFL